MEPTLNDYKLSCELLGHSMDVRAVAAGAECNDASGQVILSGSRDKTTKIWKPIGNEYIESVTLQDHKNFISFIFYLPAKKWICTASNDATVCIYKEDSFVPLLTLKGHDSTVCAIAAGVDSQSLITGSWDKTARVWSIDEVGTVSAIVFKGHEAAVWAVASWPEQEKFVTGGADKCIYYWNTKGEKLRLLKGHTDCVRALITLPDNTLISCGNDAIIRYWNEDGECIKQLSGHTNYIYSMSQNLALGEHIVATCGEDSTLRLWNIASGIELGEPILHPAVSVWSVACLSNGDIVTGSSDGVVRVFTRDATRVASEGVANAFLAAVNTRKAQMNDEIGGVKKTDLPGPEALLSNGTREGQTKMVRHQDGSVKCYSWELGKWNLVGDVTGASGGTQSTSGKQLYEGKEYDYVFDVDVDDSRPPIKLPYNRGEDPWHAAQTFIHKNNLPQAYLDQVANFIVKNSDGAVVRRETTASGYQDPFTGGARYVPGSSNANFQSGGNVDPFTGSSSYSTTASRVQETNKFDVNFIQRSDKHFPLSQFISFDTCDAQKVLNKLIEFNNSNANNAELMVSEDLLSNVIKLATENTDTESNALALESLVHLLNWPVDKLFPVLDVLRLAVRNETAFNLLQNNYKFLDLILPHINSSAANQLMIIRCLSNVMLHAAGRQKIAQLSLDLIAHTAGITTGSANLQIAIATFYLNITTAQTLSLANGATCQIVTTGIIELLKWANDLEACYRAMQAIGNITTTPHGANTTAQLITVDAVMEKIRDLTNTQHTGSFTKLNAIGRELLNAFSKSV